MVETDTKWGVCLYREADDDSLRFTGPEQLSFKGSFWRNETGHPFGNCEGWQKTFRSPEAKTGVTSLLIDAPEQRLWFVCGTKEEAECTILGLVAGIGSERCLRCDVFREKLNHGN